MMSMLAEVSPASVLPPASEFPPASELPPPPSPPPPPVEFSGFRQIPSGLHDSPVLQSALLVQSPASLGVQATVARQTRMARRRATTELRGQDPAEMILYSVPLTPAISV